MDAFFDDEPGYRIRPDEFALPDISLTADEAAVVGLATKVWQHARLAEATTEAVRKLTALGVDVDLTALDIVEPRLERRRAVVRRVLGGHPGAHAGASSTTSAPVTPRSRTRHLQPWGVVRYSGRWYVVGLDTDRGRGAGLPALPGPGRGPHGRPAGLLRGPAGHRRQRGGPAARPASRRPSASCCWSARAPATRCGAARTASRGRRRARTPTRPGTGWCSSAARRRLADEVLGYGADVYVEEPAELRDRVVGTGSRAAVAEERRVSAPAQRQGPGRPAADAGAVPPRPRRGPARRGGRRRSACRPTSCSGTSRCCSCAGCRAATPTT